MNGAASKSRAETTGGFGPSAEPSVVSSTVSSALRAVGTIFKVSGQHLRHDYGALVLTFVLPLAFFTIFAAIFGRMGGGGGEAAEQILVVGVDLDRSEASRSLLAALAEEASLDLRTAQLPTRQEPEPEPFDEEDARRLVRGGRVPAAVILPEGLGRSLGNPGGEGLPVRLLYDAADPIARHTLAGLLQAAAMRAAPALMMQRGLERLEAFGGPLTEAQANAVESFRRQLEAGVEGSSAGAGEAPFTGGLVPVEAVDVRTLDPSPEPGEGTRSQRSLVAYYAAGIGVMFLLFSMSGAAGSLLEEEESGVLERLLSTRATMTTLLAGKWLFFGLLGFCQVLLMFAWGALFFDLDLGSAKRIAGLFVMALVTGLAAAAFGLMLATICRSRAQLGGVSTVAILLMSALGGSMFPRFLMPDSMKTASLLTFNGWALDGFLKVFWYDDPAAGLVRSLVALAPQLAVLLAMTIVFLVLARRLARRWEVI